MWNELDKLEQAVEREMKLISQLPESRPSMTTMERLRRTVRNETVHYRTQQRTLSGLRNWGGIAAAVALAIGLTFGTTTSRDVADASPEQVLADWATAWDESHDRLTNVFDETWSLADGTSDLDDAGEIDELFESWDTALDQFDSL